MDATARTSRSPEEAYAKRQLRNFLLDKHLQLRSALRVIVMISAIVAVLGFFLYRTVADATDQLLAQTLGDSTLAPIFTQEAVQAFKRQAEHDKEMTIFMLLIGLVSLVILVGGLTIIYTHKIAGPVYKMRKLFGEIDGHHLQVWGKLRRADELQDIFVDFDNMLRRLREHRQEDTEELEAIREELIQKCESSDVLSRLEQLINAYRDSVKMN